MSHKISDSPIWYDLLKIKDIYLQGRGIEIRNGEKTRFWYDPWLYDKPILLIAPTLFFLCDQKDISVADIKHSRIHVTFRRWLTDELLVCWNLIMGDVNDFQLQDVEDKVVWKFGKNKHFSVKSMFD